MSDVHADLTAEWGSLVQRLTGYMDNDPVTEALLHILRRLGPPSLTEASDIEMREASEEA